MRKNNWKRKRLFSWILAVILIVVVAVGSTVFALWHHEIATLRSLKLIRERFDINMEGAVYTLHVKGDFYLDAFVEEGGARNDAELVDFIVRRITHGVFDLTIDTPKPSCSSFTAKTSNGDVLFGRNYDAAATNTCIVFTEASDGRHATISTVDLQHLGIAPENDIEGFADKVRCLAATYAPLDGINDAGVACAIYLSNQGGNETVPTEQNTERPDITPTTLIRLILDYADNVEEAVAIASSYDMHDSAGLTSHYMVADASGKSAILEWIGESGAPDCDGSKRSLRVTYNDADSSVGEMEATSGCQVVTNFIVAPGYYDNAPTSYKSGYDRYERIWEELLETGGIVRDELAAMDILAIVGRRNWDNSWRDCTAYSIVFNLTDRTMLWVPNENYDDPHALFVFDFTD